MNSHIQTSVVIPVYNEVESLKPLIDRLLPTLESLGSHEVIFVNDGSLDGSAQVLEDMTEVYPGIVKVIHLRGNKGKSLALQAGFQAVSGKCVVMMDADLQDRPEEIPSLLKHLKENNLDVVTGWKMKRLDPNSKKIASRFFNYILRKFSGLAIHDFNCGLKVMRHECLGGLKLYGQLHRFMLILLSHQGFRLGEKEIQHDVRKFGVSKYGNRRLYEGVMDFLTIIFVTRYLHSPLYIFGFYGLFCFCLSLIIGGFYLGLHFYSLLVQNPQGYLNEHPLWLISPGLLLAGLIFICFGIIGEFLIHLLSPQLFDNYVQKRVGFSIPKDTSFD
jgi:glycosyltransferase involved in cell wall biosynthesis